MDDLLSSVENIDIEVRSLETCAYTNQMFRDVLAKVQKAVDELNLHSYSNLSAWVATLDQQVQWKQDITVFSIMSSMIFTPVFSTNRIFLLKHITSGGEKAVQSSSIWNPELD